MGGHAPCANPIGLLRLVAHACPTQSQYAFLISTHETWVGAGMRAVARDALHRQNSQFTSTSRWSLSRPDQSRGRKLKSDARSKRWAKRAPSVNSKNLFHNYFLALTYDPVLENKKVNALTVSCCTWSSSRIVASKLVSTSRIVVELLRLSSCPK